jgi:mannose-6-phosphate isomerase-like protein (cupin superfamily)
MARVSWQTAQPKPDYDLLAPDGSEIRLLVQIRGGSLVHCTLRAGQVTQAVRHRTVEEVWYCTRGSGELWRRCTANEETIALVAGTAVSIPLGTDFQFRATGDVPLELVIATLPPWPGEHEAIPVEGRWQPTPA